MDAMVGVLGTTAFLLDSGPDDTWGKPRDRAVLATLVAHVGQVVPIETLLRWVWPQDQPAPLNPGPAFHTYAARIRRVLARLPSQPTLLAVDGGYRLDMDPARIDLHRFRALVATARTEDAERVIDLVEDAMWLWRGLPLADLTSEPARAWRERVLRDDWLAAHILRVRALVDLDRHRDAVAALDELLADFPDDVTLATLRLTGLYGLRRFADATSFYLATWHRFRADGDAHAARLLRRHHTALGAENTVPAVPRPTVIPRMVPRAVDDFVGRRAQLASLDEAGPAGMLLIHGAAGIGKTTLAVHWARRARARFPDGDLFVNLGGFSDRTWIDPATVVDSLLTELGQPPSPTLNQHERARLLTMLVAGRRMLVVLDDARDADHVRDLVALLPSCLVIVTSRQRLSTLTAPAGARRIAVPPMSAAESTELWSAHAYGRLVDTDRLGAVCGGLPLRITVVARLPGMPDGSVTSAYQALAAPERRLFRLLSLHPGPVIPVEAAYACDGRSSSETLKSLMALMTAQLVGSPDEHDRFSVHDLLAEFAASRLGCDEPDEESNASRARLLEFYAASAAHAAATAVPGYQAPPSRPAAHAVRFSDRSEALAWFARERPNLTAMIRYAHGESCHDQARRLADPVATLLDLVGGAVESAGVRALAVDSAHAAGDVDAEAFALHGLGLTCLALGDLDAAERSLESALGLVRADRLRGGRSAVLYQLGRVAMMRGDTEAALTLYRRGVEAAGRSDDLDALSWLHFGIGQALGAADRAHDALIHLHQARWTARQIGEREVEAASLVEIGASHRGLGEQAAALAHYKEALVVAEATPDLTAAALICVALSQINADRRRFATAVTCARRGVAILQGTQSFATRAHVTEALADTLYGSGEPHEAVLVWQQAADLYDYAGAAASTARLSDKIDRCQFPGSAPPARAGSPEPDDIDRPLSAINKTFNGPPE
jgi:tetratricopeptide (TPR) repeat protein/DNA-binding SARP family transcriptional activator